MGSRRSTAASPEVLPWRAPAGASDHGKNRFCPYRRLEWAHPALFSVSTNWARTHGRLREDFDLGDFYRSQRFPHPALRTGENQLAGKILPDAGQSSYTSTPQPRMKVINGEVVRHATLTDPETRFPPALMPTWYLIPKYGTYSEAAPSSVPCAMFLDERDFLRLKPHFAAYLWRRNSQALRHFP